MHFCSMCFTFHSGYILIGLNVLPRHVKNLYIPFWIYSNYYKISLYYIKLPLYIPFWIYSNMYSCNVSFFLFINFTFHSGYILIQTFAYQCRRVIILYIPFCIYSNYSSCVYPKWLCGLYIPFWIYSNLYVLLNRLC